MKITKLVLNLFIFIFMFIFIVASSYGIYAAFVYQNEDLERVYWSPGEESDGSGTQRVSYVDAFTFWGTNIKSGLDNEPLFIVRGWFGSEGWQKNMKWMDYVFTFCYDVIKPMFAPVYEAGQIKKYYDYDTNDRSKVRDKLINLEAKDDTNYSELVKDENLLNYAFLIDFPTYNKKPLSNNEASLLNSAAIYLIENTNGVGEFDILSAVQKKEFHRQYTAAYELQFEYNKYNIDEYGAFYNKFIKVQGEKGDIRTIKPSVSIMYFQIFLALFLATYFTIKNKVRIDVARDGTEIIDDYTLDNMPGFGAVRKANRRAKKSKLKRLKKKDLKNKE